MRSLFNLLSPPRERALWVRVLVVLACIAAAFFVRLQLHPWLGDRSPYAFLLPAVMVCAWLGGVGAGLFATVLGVVAAMWLFTDVRFTPTPGAFIAGGLVVVQGVMISLLCGMVHHLFARWRLARRQAALEFENMADHAPGFVWSTGGEGTRGFVNQSWLTFTGVEPRRTDMDRLQFVHPADVDRVREVVEQARATRLPYHVEYRLRRADGVYRWILEHAVPRLTPAGELEGFIGSGTDITPSHQEREELLFISELQRVLALSLDLDKTVEAVSLALVPEVSDWCCIRMFDEASGRLRPLSIHHFDPEKTRLWNELEQAAEAAGTRRPYVFEHLMHDGSPRLVSVVDDAFLRESAGSEEELAHLRSLGLVSCLAVPLRARGRVIGVLSMATAESGRTLGHDRLQLALKVGGIAAFALENARLYQSVRRALAAEEKARRERAHSERRFRSAWEADIFGICTVTRDGRIEAGNDAFLRVAGVRREDLLAGRVELNSCLHGAERPFGTFIWECMSPEGRCEPFEKTCIRPDGRRVPVLVGGSVQTDHDSCIVFLLDLTARKAAESALERQRLLLKTIIDAVPAMVAYIDPQERFLVHNRQYERWLGLGYDDIHGRTVRELVGEERYPEAHPHLQAALAGNNVRYEKTIVSPVRPREAMVSYRPDIGPDGEVVGVVIHAYDVTESRRLADAVARSEKRYRTLITASAAIVWTADSGGRLLEMNGWESFTGRAVDKDIDDCWMRMIHPEDRARVGRQWRDACRETRSWDCVYRLLACDGRYHHVHARGAAVASADGGVEEWIGTVTDISLRMEAEQSLRRKEAELKLIVDTVPALVAYVDRSQRYILVNQAYKKWFGIDPDHMRGRTVVEVVGQEAYAVIREKLERVLGGEVVRYESYMPYRYGAPRWVSITLTPHFGDQGVVVGYFGLVLDITERKQSERELADLLERYRFLADAMPQNVWTANAAGEQDYVNRRWVEYSGLSAQDGGSNRWAEIVHPEDRAATAEIWRRSVATGAPYWMEHRLRDAHGNYNWFLSLALARRDEQGRVVQWVGTATNIEAQRRAYAELAEARGALKRHADNLENEVRLRTARLEEVNSELEAFTYSASHDLRVPLHHIHGFAEAILEDGESRMTPESLRNLGHIVAATERMDRLVIDLLAYSRMSRGEFAITATSLEDVVAEVLLHHRASIEAAHAVVRVERPLPRVPADRVGLHQVLLNLVGNALKFVAPGRTPEVTLRTERRDDRTRLWVEDKGIGIDPRHHQAIFKIFQRLHGSRDYAGTGIGLSLVKKGMTRMGGECGVESVVGAGSRFWLEFAPDPASAETSPAPTLVAASGAGP